MKGAWSKISANAQPALGHQLQSVTLDSHAYAANGLICCATVSRPVSAGQGISIEI